MTTIAELEKAMGGLTDEFEQHRRRHDETQEDLDRIRHDLGTQQTRTIELKDDVDILRERVRGLEGQVRGLSEAVAALGPPVVKPQPLPVEDLTDLAENARDALRAIVDILTDAYRRFRRDPAAALPVGGQEPVAGDDSDAAATAQLLIAMSGRANMLQARYDQIRVNPRAFPGLLQMTLAAEIRATGDYYAGARQEIRRTADARPVQEETPNYQGMLDVLDSRQTDDAISALRSAKP